MARFLFTSVPGRGAQRQSAVDDGPPRRRRSRRRVAGRGPLRGPRPRAGVQHVPVWVSTDYSLYDDPFDVLPELRRPERHQAAQGGVPRGVPRRCRGAGHRARATCSTRFRADVLVSAGPQFGPLLVAERTRRAAGGDRRRPVLEVRRRRHATVRPRAAAVAGRDRPGTQPYCSTGSCAASSLTSTPDGTRSAPNTASDHRRIGCSTRWAKPTSCSRAARPASSMTSAACRTPVHFVGAHRPLAPADWEPPRWWDDLDGGRPGGPRHPGDDSRRSQRAGAPDREGARRRGRPRRRHHGSDRPGNARRRSPPTCERRHSCPTRQLLAKASAFVTNGGYIGTNLALHHGVPIVQVGDTEEKAEIGARIEHFGVGVAFKKTPAPRRLRKAVRGLSTMPPCATVSRGSLPTTAATMPHGESRRLLVASAIWRGSVSDADTKVPQMST